MTIITLQHIDYAQRTGLLAYMRKKNIEFEIEIQPTNSFIKSIEELQLGQTYRLENTENPIEEILR